MSASGEDLNKSEEILSRENEPVTDNDSASKGDKNEEINPVSKWSGLLTFFRNLLPAIKETVSVAFKTFKERSKGAMPEEKDGSNGALSEQHPFLSEDIENYGGEISENTEELEDSGEPAKKSWLKKLSRKDKIMFSGAVAVFIATIIAFYVGYNSTSGTTGKNAVDSAEQVQQAEPGFFDFIASIFQGKKSTEHLTAEEKLQAMGLRYTEGEFVRSAGRNNTAAVDAFIENGMPIDSKRKSDGVTPLMAAASYHQTEMVNYLLDQGADINATDNEGQTALMKAVKYNRDAVVEALLTRGADVNVVDVYGNTALSMANESSTHGKVVEVFFRFGIDVSTAKKMPPPKKDDKDARNNNKNISGNDIETDIQSALDNSEGTLTLQEIRRIMDEARTLSIAELNRIFNID